MKRHAIPLTLDEYIRFGEMLGLKIEKPEGLNVQNIRITTSTFTDENGEENTIRMMEYSVYDESGMAKTTPTMILDQTEKVKEVQGWFNKALKNI